MSATATLTDSWYRKRHAVNRRNTTVATARNLHYRARVTFDVVVAADLDWGIGKDNGLPWPRLKGDMAHFRRITSTCEPGKLNAIIMGRKTWESNEMRGQ